MRIGPLRMWRRVVILGGFVFALVGMIAPLQGFAQDGSNDPLCDAFPQYCVPLAGGAPADSLLAEAEASLTRLITPRADLPEGVVRGITSEGIPFIGDPDAPVRFRLYENFTCGHCLHYHEDDFQRFLVDYVLTGQAVFEAQLLSFGARPYSDNAAYAALCAAEQDAYWEMTATLFRAFENHSTPTAYSLDAIREAAVTLGLDTDQLLRCVSSGRYAERLPANLEGAYDLAVTGTPSVVVQVEGAPGWMLVSRDYGTLADLTAEALGVERVEYGFTTSRADGEPLSLADFEGQQVLLFFWNSICEGCEATIDAMNLYHRLHQYDNLTVVGVNVMEGVVSVQSVIAARSLVYPVALDLMGEVTAQYGVDTLPAVFLFDAGGKLLAQWDEPFDLERLERHVTPLIAPE